MEGGEGRSSHATLGHLLCGPHLDVSNLNMWGGAEDVEDSLSHILWFETLYMLIGGSCLLGVLVMEFEGKLCLHQAWRDARGPDMALGLQELLP